VEIPRPSAGLALHAVLSATASSQVVLLERTRNGSVLVLGPGLDNADPVVNDAGLAESGALVRLSTPSGRTLLAMEDNNVRSDGKGFGNYRFQLPGSELERGGVYRLSVQTIAGENLSGETTVPSGVAADLAEQRRFDRSRDTLAFQWPASSGASSYYVRIETPFGPRAFFTDSTQLRLAGDLRNVDVETLPHVFIPGFPQAVTVSAVDGNFYDWFRTHNDPLSGVGLVSRVQGGLGVFGSLVRLRYDSLSVVAPQVEPIEGNFRFTAVQPGEVPPYLGLELYVESHASRASQPDALSGRYQVRGQFGYTGCLVCGLLGTVKDGKVELALLAGWSARDTTEIFTGEIRGDTIVGTYRGFGGVAHFVRQR
jgi:hypothetical protein